ncbi:MAG: vWA domain-containing protein [Pseudomonadota bacterium]
MKTRSFGGRFQDISGQTAVLFALALMPIFAIVGLAVDSARLISAEQHLQRAIDAAALAGAKDARGSLDETDPIKELVERVFFANLETSHSDLACESPNIDIDMTTNTARVSSECNLPTIFGRTISGQQTMKIAERAEAQASFTELEVVLMMDISESMEGQSLIDTKAAANDLIIKLMGTGVSDHVRISVVPYGTTINAGIYGNKAMGRADLDDTFGDGIDTVCMTDRTGPEAMTDAPPRMGQWLSDNTDPAFTCHGPPILPLSDNAVTVSDTINALASDPDAKTAGHLALAWSWYALSPDWHSIWPSTARPAEYHDADTKKVVVLMTDGTFNAYWVGTTLDEMFGIPHRLAREFCQSMKDEGILVYSVGFGLDPPLIDTSMTAAEIEAALAWDSSTTLSECASAPELVFLPETGDDLRDVYNEIATGLKGIALTN